MSPKNDKKEKKKKKKDKYSKILLVHFGLIRSIMFSSVHFGSIWSI